MTDPEFRLPSGKALVVLELLVARREMYGLEMVKASGKLRRGTIYVLLSRMEADGYVKSREQKDEGMPGLPRRLYRVTGLGQRAYQAVQQAKAVFACVPGLAGV